MTIERHYTKVDTRGFDDNKEYVGVCSCGWVSHPQDTEQLAEDECTDHVVYIG